MDMDDVYMQAQENILMELIDEFCAREEREPSSFELDVMEQMARDADLTKAVEGIISGLIDSAGDQYDR